MANDWLEFAQLLKPEILFVKKMCPQPLCLSPRIMHFLNQGPHSSENTFLDFLSKATHYPRMYAKTVVLIR